MPFHNSFDPSVDLFSPSLSSLLHALCGLLCYDVAVVTRPPCEGRMVISLEELRILRRMRIMTMSAVDHRGIYANVSFAKGGTLQVMAFPTQRLNLLTQQRGFNRKMRLMASFAIARSRLMGLLLFDLRFEVFVTREAEIRTLG